VSSDRSYCPLIAGASGEAPDRGSNQQEKIMSSIATRRTRRVVLGLAAAGALVAVPSVAHAVGPVGPLVVSPGSTVCVKESALSGAHAEGQATGSGAGFSVFRNGTLVYLTPNFTGGFGADFTGGGNYKLCATNHSTTTNTKVTLTLRGF
jgi:hypothetical protein